MSKGVSEYQVWPHESGFKLRTNLRSGQSGWNFALLLRFLATLDTASVALNMPFFAKKKRQLPPTVATDDIIPVHLFDGSAAARNITMVWTFKFDDILDPCAIHDALTQLFQMDGWRKFSGRLRLRVSGHFQRCICSCV